jgi:hypothetical protein
VLFFIILEKKMGNPRVGGSLPQALVKRAQEAPAPKLANFLPQNLSIKRQMKASEHSDINRQELAQRTADRVAAQPKVRANALEAGGKKTIIEDVNTPGMARHETARTIGNRTANYQLPFQKDGSITVSGNKPGAPGYIEGLLEAKTPEPEAEPISSFEVEKKRVELRGNNRDRIAVIYEKAYKATGQAQRSADEISHALRQAVPEGVRSLGNIG